MSAKILVVDDEPSIVKSIQYSLEKEGYQVVTANDGQQALEVARREKPNLVVLDVMLPGMDGVSVCQELRKSESSSADAPVIMLTARDDETSVVVGLEVGADDYMTKPFRPRELVSRVRAHLRRRRMDSKATSGEGKKLAFPGLEVDLFGRRVIAGGEEVELTAKEFDVLGLLASSPGRVYSREQIMRHLWDGDFFGETRAADVHIQHVRKKIEPDAKNPRYLLTVRGVGYKFADI